MKKKNSVSSKRHVHNGSLKKIADFNMSCASITKLVETNKNACFIISKNKFLISLSLKLCASLIPHAVNQDALLNIKSQHKVHKAR